MAAFGNKGPAEPRVDGSFTVSCEYKRRLMLVDVAQKDPRDRLIEVVDATASGMLQVCVRRDQCYRKIRNAVIAVREQGAMGPRTGGCIIHKYGQQKVNVIG